MQITLGTAMSVGIRRRGILVVLMIEDGVGESPIRRGPRLRVIIRTNLPCLIRREPLADRLLPQVVGRDRQVVGCRGQV